MLKEIVDSTRPGLARPIGLSPRLACTLAAALSVSASLGVACRVQADERPVPRQTLIPTDETQASDFLRQHPEYDGRGITVAIFDTGVDPGAAGLRVTSTGQPKIIDLIDGTGAGDVEMQPLNPSALTKPVRGLSGRTLKLPAACTADRSRLALGLAAAYDILDSELVADLKQQRLKRLRKRLVQRSARYSGTLRSNDSDRTKLAQELDALAKNLTDPGPVCDCVTYKADGELYAIVDTDADGDLTDERALRSFRIAQEFAAFRFEEAVNFGVNIYNNGRLLSIVVDSGAHGTHVASITAGCFPRTPSENGVAPGAQLISVKIGDPRVGGMETGQAIERGLRAVERHGCQLINMSFGEPTAAPLSGRIAKQIQRTIERTGVIFVSSAMNSGPALSTVGAPGGTVRGVFGVGAYISPEMAREGYAASGETPPVGYVWTSRGPTRDGSLGVDLFAPGGAYAAVPRWTRQRIQRMHGTSMASPNACGCLALMLSGLLQNDHSWNPSTVLAAVQSTAAAVEGVDAWTQGPGLIQTSDAYQSLLERTAPERTLPRIDVTARHATRAGRGIYLREASETDRLQSISVRLEPHFEEGQRRRFDNRFPLLLDFQSSAEWVQAGGRVRLPAGGQTMTVRVDPTQLDPGAHFAEIRGYEVGTDAAEAVIRIPVTVVRSTPVPVGATQLRGSFQLQAGAVQRKFVQIPADVQQVRIQLKRDAEPDSRLLVLQTLQLAEHEPFRRTNHREFLSVAPAMTISRQLAVIPGRVLELTLAQDWSSPQESQVELELELVRGDVSGSVALSSAQPLAELALHNSTLTPQTWSLQAELTEHAHVLQPRSSSIVIVRDPRDRSFEAERVFELTLNYEFDLTGTAQLDGHLNGQWDLLYESYWGGYLWIVENEEGRVVHSADIFPAAGSFKKGHYKIRVKLRSDSKQTLESFQQQAFVLTRKLSSPVSVRLFGSRVDAIANQSAVSSLSLSPGERRFVVLKDPHLGAAKQNLGSGWPLKIGAADQLNGQLKLQTSEWGDSKRLVRSIPLHLALAAPAAASSGGSSSADVQTAYREQLAAHNPRDVRGFEAAFQAYIEKYPDDVRVYQVRLHWWDAESTRKQRLARIVSAADDLIERIDQSELRQVLFRERQLPGKKAGAAQAKKQLEWLTDALYRKGRALGYMELPDVVARTPIDDPEAHGRRFEDNLRQLDEWADLSDQQFVLLLVRYHRRQGELGAALELLRQAESRYGQQFWYDKKRRDIYGELGWDEFTNWAHSWLLRRYPDRARSEAVKYPVAADSDGDRRDGRAAGVEGQ